MNAAWIPNQTNEVMKRAALLIQEVAGGTITGAIQDIYPVPVAPYRVELTYDKVNTLIGKVIRLKRSRAFWKAWK